MATYGTRWNLGALVFMALAFGFLVCIPHKAARAEEYQLRELPNLISCYGITPSPDGRHFFTTSDNGIVGIFDATDGRYQRAIDLRDLVVWSAGGVIANGKLYVESFRDIVVIDIETFEVVTLLPQQHYLGSHFGDLVATNDGSTVWGIIGSTTHLTGVDTETDTITAEIEVGGNFTGIAMSVQEDRIYLTSKEDARFVIVDLETQEVTLDSSYITEEDGFLEFPTEAKVGPDGTVYVSYIGGDFAGRVACITRDGELFHTFKATTYSTGIEVTSDGEFLILGNGEVFATQFGETVAQFALPIGLGSVTMSADGGTASTSTRSTASPRCSSRSRKARSSWEPRSFSICGLPAMAIASTRSSLPPASERASSSLTAACFPSTTTSSSASRERSPKTIPFSTASSISSPRPATAWPPSA